MAAGALALGLLAAGTDGTRSAWPSASTTGTGTAQSGALGFAHAYQATSCSLGTRIAGSQACSGSIAPTTGASVSGVSATDAITNDGTAAAARLQAEVSAASCAPVKLDNRVAAANPLMPRHGTTFHTSGGPMGGAGFVTLDGAAPGGYATSVVAATQPGGGLLSAGRVSGVGVWFKAAPGTTGPLFSFSPSPSNNAAAGVADRALSLDGDGRLRLVWNQSGSSIGPSSSTYDDDAWHFAYVTFGGVSVVLLGLIPQVTLWVDGVQQATTPLLSLAPISSYSGYWHLGWAPTSVTGLGTAYLDASLSNFVVINAAGSVPTGGTIGTPSTQAAFNSATSAATDHWVLDDPGTTTFGGTLPATMTGPCGKVGLDWTFTGPTATAASSVALSTFADGTWHAVDAPEPGATQTSTITVEHGPGYAADLAGLRLYAPLSYRVQTSPAGSAWSQTFTWSGAESAFVA